MKQAINVLLLVVVVLSGDCSYAENETRASGTVPGRIIGGSNANIEDYPFVLRMTIVTTDGESAGCGASVIGRFYALTAAHCFYGMSIAKFTLLGGSTFQSVGGTVFNGESYTMHPSYNNSNRDNDAALVKVATSFFSNPLIKSIPLQNTEPAVAIACYALGWGNTSPTGPESDILQRGNYVLRPETFCNRIWKYAQEITPQMYCGTAPRGRTCYGDSGGPLVCAGLLHGIVSFGVSKCEADVAEGFAKVASPSIRNFIRQVSGI